MVAAIALVPIAGFLTTGTSAYIASGSSVKSFLDEDISFQAEQPPIVQPPIVQAPVVQAPVEAVPAVQPTAAASQP